MKQFIVLLATLPLMLGLIMQIGLSQSVWTLAVRAEQIVREGAEAAAEAGGFGSGIREDIAGRIARAAGVPQGSVSVEADRTPDAEGRLSYRVTVPVRRLVAAPRLFGVSDADNKGTYTIEGSVRAREEPVEQASESGITRESG
jgi:hypothetical protein